MRETFDEAMEVVKVDLVRGDSGFDTDEILSSLEARSLNNQATLATLISYIAIGGWVSQHACKRVLKLSLPHQKRPWMDAIFRQIEARPPPFAYSIA